MNPIMKSHAMVVEGINKVEFESFSKFTNTR